MILSGLGTIEVQRIPLMLAIHAKYRHRGVERPSITRVMIYPSSHLRDQITIRNKEERKRAELEYEQNIDKDTRQNI